MTVEHHVRKKGSPELRDYLSWLRGQGLRVVCGTLLLRTVPVYSVYDIVGITGFTRHQIYRQVEFMRASGELPPLTAEDLYAIKVKSYKKRPLPGTPEYEAEQRRFAVARGLMKAGFIARETTQWDRLHALYQRHQRPLPDGFAIKIRSEAFLVVHEQWRRGNQEPLGLFGRVLKEADPSLFQDLKLRAEHQFIMAAVTAEHGEVRPIGDPQVVTSIMIPAGGGVVEVVRNSIP